MSQKSISCSNSRFYDEGFKDGTQHGRLHGLIEGRALGKEKGFEMWEEVGFYLGFATAWMALLQMQSDPKYVIYLPPHSRGSNEFSSKVISHLSHLLGLVASFPTRNPSTTLQEGAWLAHFRNDLAIHT